MIGSDTVLCGQAVIYTIYVVAIMLLVGWFAYSITREGPSKVSPRLFYSFVGSLVVTQGTHWTTQTGNQLANRLPEKR